MYVRLDPYAHTAELLEQIKRMKAQHAAAELEIRGLRTMVAAVDAGENLPGGIRDARTAGLIKQIAELKTSRDAYAKDLEVKRAELVRAQGEVNGLLTMVEGQSKQVRGLKDALAEAHRDRNQARVDAAERNRTLTVLTEAVHKLYYAACWFADRPVNENALWTAVRDAAGFTPGDAPTPTGGGCALLLAHERVKAELRGVRVANADLASRDLFLRLKITMLSYVLRNLLQKCRAIQVLDVDHAAGHGYIYKGPTLQPEFDAARKELERPIER